MVLQEILQKLSSTILFLLSQNLYQNSVLFCENHNNEVTENAGIFYDGNFKFIGTYV